MAPPPRPSTRPPPQPRLTPSCASHPPPHTQCANNGYVQPAKSAVDAQLAPRRQRSFPAPSGISAAMPTLNTCSHTVSAPRGPSCARPPKKNGSAPLQFHDLPATAMACDGPPGNPCQDHPKTKYARTATAAAQIEPNMAWAALRERPSPA